MSELQKARLQEVRADESQSTIGEALPVQFNPNSLRLKLTNQSSGGRSRARQRRQNNGQGSTVLSMDLIFDSADEGDDTAPVSVREKTNMVERFVLPKEEGGEAPPLLRFEWDQLIIVGIVESLDITFEHFAANGAPLRAKMSLSIKEQEPKYAYLKLGKGAKDASGASKSGSGGSNTPGNGTNEPGAGPGSDKSAAALDGETAADFLARQGLDPSAWRGLDVDLSAGLSLQAGVEVGFSAGLSASLGVGVSAGVHATAGVSLQASLGIEASASVSASTSSNAATNASVKATASTQTQKVNGDKAGLALSAAGGVQAAIESVKINDTGAASARARAAFELPRSSSSATPSSPASSAINYSPLARSQLAKPDQRQLPNAAGYRPSQVSTNLPQADPRSTSYGYGVPLRPLYQASTTQQQVKVHSREQASTAKDAGPVFRRNRSTSPWQELPSRDVSTTTGDQATSGNSRNKCKQRPYP